MKKSRARIIDSLLENGSYKLVALFVTLILWVTILGRRDVVLSKDVDLEFLLPRDLVIVENIERRVQVKVAGPRAALKKFQANPGALTVDLSRYPRGPVRAVINPKLVDVPFGVKVLAISPEYLDVTLSTPVAH